MPYYFTLFFKLFVLFIYLVLISFFIVHPAFAQFSQSFDAHVNTPFIKRSNYESSYSSSIVLNVPTKSHKGQSSSFSPFSNTTTSILSSVAGVLSVFAGTIFTWVKLKRKNSMFNKYLKQIEDERKQALGMIHSSSSDREKILKSVQVIYKNIQENADLSAADKKIEDIQLTVISHKIERAINDLSSTE